MKVTGLVLLLACVVAARAWHQDQWTKQSAVPESQMPLKLTVGLRLQHMDQLQAFLDSVSNPKSELYGKYMSRQEVAALVSPSSSAVAAVRAFFFSHNVPNTLSAEGDLLTIRPTVAQASSLFSASLATFVHSSGLTIVRSTNGYKVPASIASHVACIAGITGFPHVPSANVDTASNPAKVTPSSIRERYHVTVPDVVPSNLQAVVSFLDQWFSHSDLQDFFNLYEPDMVGMVPSQLIGANNDSDAGMEATLDIQYLMGITENVDTWVYFTPGTIAGGNEPWLDWFSTLESETTIPYVFSMSYQDLEPTVDYDYASRVNDEFMKYSASGHTFVTGSGDWGVGCSLDVCDRFTPDFPSSSPYVVSLGGTTITSAGDLEEGVDFSSGGFSDYFPRPAYQDDIINTWMQDSTVPPETLFNTTGRGFPDLSTVATNFQVVFRGFHTSVGGTSAATPAFASMLSLINSMRLAAGLPTLGWVNPFLYQAYTENAFTDITKTQPQDTGCCPQAFTTTAGWDPVTGMGVPNFDKLASLAMDSTFCHF